MLYVVNVPNVVVKVLRRRYELIACARCNSFWVFGLKKPKEVSEFDLIMD